MKNIFTLIAILFSITTFAAPGPRTSKIAISSNDRARMQVKINGVMYNLNNTFVLDNIRPGNHSITIYKTESFGFRKKTQVIYNSTMFINPAQSVNIDINRSGKVVVKITSNYAFDRNSRNNRDNDGRYDNDRNDRNNNGRDNNYRRY